MLAVQKTAHLDPLDLSLPVIEGDNQIDCPHCQKQIDTSKFTSSLSTVLLCEQCGYIFFKIASYEHA